MATYPDYPAPHSRVGNCLGLLLFLVLLAVAGFLFWQYFPRGSGLNAAAEPRPVAARGDLSELEKANIQIYQTVSPSVVQVTNLTAQGTGLSLNIQKIPQGVGSGFVWDEDGHIVTNYHVVRGADAAQVTLADHRTYDARQIWAYPEQDVAVIWIQAPRGSLHPIPVGSSADVKVGQMTYAIGDPFGLAQTMTMGIVSALGREIESESGAPIRGVIQTSAPINPGNSGGPLLDSSGRLIGMSTAIISPSGVFAGIGFAIPVDEINRIVPQLIRHGKVVRPRMGVQIAEDQVAEQLGIGEGALILKVVPNSPAAQAGLQGSYRDDAGHIHLGDVIIAVDAAAVKNGKDLYSLLEHHQPGDTVTLKVQREGKTLDVKVILKAAE